MKQILYIIFFIFFLSSCKEMTKYDACNRLTNQRRTLIFYGKGELSEQAYLEQLRQTDSLIVKFCQ